MKVQAFEPDLFIEYVLSHLVSAIVETIEEVTFDEVLLNSLVSDSPRVMERDRRDDR
jgi:hypothetical protein